MSRVMRRAPLGAACLLAVWVAVAAGQTAEPAVGTTTFTISLGEVEVPGSCSSVESYESQKTSQRALAWRAGQASLSARVRMQRPLTDRLSINRLKECTRQAANEIPAALRAAAGSEAEAALSTATNACLQSRGATVQVRALALSRGSPVCR